MPSFEVTISVDFEAFCENCGSGMCYNITTRKSYNRHIDQIVIEPCKICIDNAKKEAIEDYEEGQRNS